MNLASSNMSSGEAQVHVVHIKCRLVKILRGPADALCWSGCDSAKKDPFARGEPGKTE